MLNDTAIKFQLLVFAIDGPGGISCSIDDGDVFLFCGGVRDGVQMRMLFSWIWIFLCDDKEMWKVGEVGIRTCPL